MKQFWKEVGNISWTRNWTLVDLVIYGILVKENATGASFWTFVILWALWMAFSLWFQRKRDPELFKNNEEVK